RRRAAPLSDPALKIVIREVVRRNLVQDGIVYLQITRGVAPRDHAFPKAARPVLTVTSRSRRSADPRVAAAGVAVITLPDLRWRRCDIKSVALLPNVLGKQQARGGGAYGVGLVDEGGQGPEGASTISWMVTAEGFVFPRRADAAILNGISRLAVLDIIRREGYRLVERSFTVAEARSASEAFLTSTTAGLLPMVKIDGIPVGSGVPGPITLRLRELYLAHSAAAA